MMMVVVVVVVVVVTEVAGVDRKEWWLVEGMMDTWNLSPVTWSPPGHLSWTPGLQPPGLVLSLRVASPDCPDRPDYLAD